MHTRREVAWGQVPYLLGSVGLTVFLMDDAPELILQPAYLLSGVLVVIATVIGFIIPTDRPSRNLLVLVPALDIVASLLIRDPLWEVYPENGILLALPIFWLAWTFSWKFLAPALAAVFLIRLFPLALHGGWPIGPARWIEFLLPAMSMAVFAVTIHLSGNYARRQRDRLQAVSDQLRASLMATEERERTIRSVLDAIDSPVVFMDMEGRPILNNHAGRELATKAGVDGTTGEETSALLWYEDRTTKIPAEDQIFAQALAGNLVNARVTWVGPRESQIAIRATSSYVYTASGEKVGAVIVGYDVTPLVEAISIRDEFLSTTSHELRTPLTSIIGYLELIDAEALGIVREISIIERNALRLLAMISNLLDAGGETNIRRIAIDVAPIVEAAVESVRIGTTTASTPGVHIMLLECDPVIAEVDSAGVAQIVTNILSNAIKFTSPPGLVTVSLGRHAGSLFVQVADSGVGISDEDQRQMFDRFFRSRAARIGAVPGAGLGLAIVKSLVDAHGGSIEVESVLGEGTTVTVRLPLERVRGT